MTAEPLGTADSVLLDCSEGVADALRPLLVTTLLTILAPRTPLSLSSESDMLANDAVEALTMVEVDRRGLRVSSELRGESRSG